MDFKFKQDCKTLYETDIYKVGSKSCLFLNHHLEKPRYLIHHFKSNMSKHNVIGMMKIIKVIIRSK